MIKSKMRLGLALLVICLSFNAFANKEELAAIKPSATRLAKYEHCLASKAEATQGPCASIELTIDLTQHEWLNQYLLNKLQLISLEEQQKNKNLSTENLTKALKQQVANWLVEALDEIKQSQVGTDFMALGREYLASLKFVQQRYNLVTFKLFNYSYMGGAHGMHFTSYFVLDLHTQQPVQLNNLIDAEKHSKLAEHLFTAYTQYDAQLAEGWLASREETLATLITNNFYLNEEGLNFVYAPYTLAPYAYGEVVLTLNYADLTQLLSKEYLLEVY